MLRDSKPRVAINAYSIGKGSRRFFQALCEGMPEDDTRCSYVLIGPKASLESLGVRIPSAYYVPSFFPLPLWDHLLLPIAARRNPRGIMAF